MSGSFTTKALALGTCVVACFALVVQQAILIDNIPENGLTVLSAIGQFLLFFTVLSNMLVAVSLGISYLLPGAAMGRFFSRSCTRAAIGLYILIVGLVYNAVLRHQWSPQGWQRVVDELLHVVVPVLYLVYWWIAQSGKVLQWRMLPYWLIYPGLYLVYALVRGQVEGKYPYPFINVDELGWNRVLLNAGGVMLVFLFCGSLMIWVTRRSSRLT